MQALVEECKDNGEYLSVHHSDATCPLDIGRDEVALYLIMAVVNILFV